MDGEDVLLDLGQQPGPSRSWSTIAFHWSWTALLLFAVITGPGPWPVWVVAGIEASQSAWFTWQHVITVSRVTIGHDGQIVLHRRLFTRRFSARAVTRVWRGEELGVYILEWGPDRNRARVWDFSAHLLRTLAVLNPDAELPGPLEPRPAARAEPLPR